jgi:hypothetical protein
MMRRLLTVLAIVALVAVACGDDDAAETTEVPATTASSTTTTTAAPSTTATTAAPTTTAAAVLESSVTSDLTGTYVFGDGSGEATVEELGFDPADVTVHWFRGDDSYVAVFSGLPADASPYLCPGTSIFQSTGWFHVSNTAAPGADCAAAVGFGLEVVDSVPGVSGGQLCNGTVSVITAISSDQDGDLFGTVEIYPPDGRFLGATGSVDGITAADVPDIDQASLSC